MNRFTISLLLAALAATSAQAEQKFKTRENGKVAFRVSENDVTRLRFVGDRVVEIITDETAFEHKNDENSGDLFFRKIEGAEAKVERGFLITEKGVTLSFQMTPVNKPTDDIVIDVVGRKTKASKTSVGDRAVISPARSVPQASGYKGSLINVIRDVVLNDLPSKKGRRAGRSKSYSKGGFKIDVHLISGGKSGKQINEVEFARKGVLAVWAEAPQVPVGGSSWLVVVRK